MVVDRRNVSIVKSGDFKNFQTHNKYPINHLVTKALLYQYLTPNLAISSLTMLRS